MVNTNDPKTSLQVSPESQGSENAMLNREELARAERLIRARVEAGLASARAAASEKGWTESTYRSHENSTRPITKAAAVRYASGYGVRLEWLWTGKGEMKEAGRPDPVPNVVLEPRTIAQAVRKMPLYGRVRAGEAAGIVIDQSPSEQIDRPRSLDSVDDAYALEVIGTSMEPRYFAGEIVHLHPGRAVHKGSFVALQVKSDDGEICGYVKRFVRRTAEHVVVEQLNPEQEIKFDAARVIAVHLIIGSAIR